MSKPGRYERHVYVYIPKQVKPNAPFMVVQDGHSYINRMAPVLEEMMPLGVKNEGKAATAGKAVGAGGR